MPSDTTSSTHKDLTPAAGLRMVGRRDFLVAGAALAASAGIGIDAPARAGTAIEQAPAGPPVGSDDVMHMRDALKLMREAGVILKTGGPFGAVIVRDGKVLATSGNSVMRDHDPTAHAEVNAIRAACRAAASPHIDGAVMYSSCEPCPMCYATAYWARVGKIFYGASYADYADLFDDANIQGDITRPYPQRQVAMQQILRPEAQVVWQEFRQLPDRARY